MLSRLSSYRNRFAYIPARTFAAINPANVNLDQITPQDIQDSSTSGVGAVVVALSKTDNVHEDICHEIDEHFRTNFRKVSFEDAKKIIVGLGTSDSKLIQGLDDKFWVWETLEEAARPHVDTLSAEDCDAFNTGMTI